MPTNTARACRREPTPYRDGRWTSERRGLPNGGLELADFSRIRWLERCRTGVNLTIGSLKRPKFGAGRRATAHELRRTEVLVPVD